MHAWNYFKNKIFWKRMIKKLILIFLSNLVPFNGQSYQKQKGPETSDHSLFRLQNKFRKIPLLVMLSDQVWWHIIKWFLSYSKNCICKFMQDKSWHKLFQFHLSFWVWKVWKEREKIQKFEHLENEKSFFDEIKYIFHSFWRAIIWWKIKNLIKNSWHKL